MAIISILLAILFIIDRIVKLTTVIHFFNRSAPVPPEKYPTISLIQPITRGAANLEYNLHSRFNLDYPAPIQHILICDAADTQSQSICHYLQDYYSTVNINILTVEPNQGNIASKITKLQSGIAIAQADILCFIDDDIALKSNAFLQMIPYLLQSGVGATFGLACANNWHPIWSSLMSIFVNANALISYIPISYFTEPFTITGHFFAIDRTNFDAAGGLANMDSRIDDDHELARRLKAIKLKAIQTPIIYQVSNEFSNFFEYANQIKRWFVFPRQSMIEYLSLKERIISYTLSLGLFIPSLAAILALLFPSPINLLSLLTILLVYLFVYVFCSFCYLKQSIFPWQLLLLTIVAIITPIQIFWALLLGDNEIMWRGQRLRIEKGGKYQVIK
ncbi:MAG TPA: glycosyltransferase family 2 protein [Leptolyngbyaceae cyanobacterium]